MSNYTRTRRLLVALFVSLAAAAVMAASPHYKKDGQPVCTINTINGTATCTAGTVAGLGNESVRVSVSLGASARRMSSSTTVILVARSVIVSGSMLLDDWRGLTRENSLNNKCCTGAGGRVIACPVWVTVLAVMITRI